MVAALARSSSVACKASAASNGLNFSGQAAPLGSAERAEVRDHAVHGLGQRWQVLFDDQPDRPEVNAELAMHDHVAKPGEFAPWDSWLGGLDLARQALA